jgi:hypothetical protein
MKRKCFTCSTKKLRNAATNQVRQDTKHNNEERIEKAAEQKEIWKVVNDIISPQIKKSMTPNEDGKVIEHKKRNWKLINSFFKNKIINLRENIDQAMVTSQTEKQQKDGKKFFLTFLFNVSEKRSRRLSVA